MKKIFYIITLAILITSCKNDLLDTTPYDKAAEESMWLTESLADQGVIGIYNGLRNNYVAGAPYHYDVAGPSGDMPWSNGVVPLKNNQIGASSTIFSNYWSGHYELIHRANDAIANLHKAPISEEKYSRLISESKFLRAFGYYRLNMVFRGVPVYLEPTASDQFTKPRESESKVWEIILDDLTDCIKDPNLVGKYAAGTTDYGRVTKGAAYALRGKVYMWMKEYEKAEQDFKQIGPLGFSLYEGSFGDIFTEEHEQSPEMIFSLQCTNVIGLGNIMSWYYGNRNTYGSCINECIPSTDFIDTFEWQDGRPFRWDDVFPDYYQMQPAQRMVFFLRDGLTNEEVENLVGAEVKSHYLHEGNEARLLDVYNSRDPRMTASVITPYSTFDGVSGTTANTYTLRWPYIGYDNQAPYDIRTNTVAYFYYLFRKFVGTGTNPYINRETSPIDLPIIRYADVLLGLAEALNEQGKTEEATGYVNMVRRRAGVAELNSNSNILVSGPDDLRRRIQRERRWELMGEGANYFEELRWGTLKESTFFEGAGIKEIFGRITGYSNTWNDKILMWPIPPSEREKNPNLTQNPGWDS